MTKEDILDKYEKYAWELDQDSLVLPYKLAEKAMDEYAKQQAIAFAMYTADNLWAVYSRTGMWYQHMDEDNPITGEQLYNQFIEQQNKP